MRSRATHRAWLFAVCTLAASCSASPRIEARPTLARRPPHREEPEVACPPELPPTDVAPVLGGPSSLVPLTVFFKTAPGPSKEKTRTIDLGVVRVGKIDIEIIAADGLGHRAIDIGTPAVREDLVAAGLSAPTRALWARWFALERETRVAMGASFEARARAGELSDSSPRLSECARVAELSHEARAKALKTESDEAREALVAGIRTASGAEPPLLPPEARFALAYALHKRRAPDANGSLTPAMASLDLYGSVIGDKASSAELVLAARMEQATIFGESDQSWRAIDVLREAMNGPGDDVVRATAAYDAATLAREPVAQREWFRRALEIAASNPSARIVEVAATCELAYVEATSGSPQRALAMAVRCSVLGDTSEAFAGGSDPMAMAPTIADALEEGAIPAASSAIPNGLVGPLGELLAESDLRRWDWDGAKRALDAIIRFDPEGDEAPRALAGLVALSDDPRERAALEQRLVEHYGPASVWRSTRRAKLERDRKPSDETPVDDGLSTTPFEVPPRPQNDAEMHANLRQRLSAIFVACAREKGMPAQSEMRIAVDTTSTRSTLEVRPSASAPLDHDSRAYVACVERGATYFESIGAVHLRAVVVLPTY